MMMSIRLTAVFPGEDAADLAVMSLREKGCEVISRETRERLRPGAVNEVGGFWYEDFSPLPMQDNGSFTTLRMPGIPHVRAMNVIGMQSETPGGVELTLRVPEASADLAERLLYNRGASHVRRLG